MSAGISFDDLIPQKGQGGGDLSFDDLIPATPEAVARTPDAPPNASPVPAAAPAAAAPAERTWGDTLHDVIMTGAQGARGVRQGAAGILGFIPDLGLHAINNAPRLANLIPGVDNVGPISDTPLTVTGALDNILSGGGAIPELPAPDGFLQRGARRIGQEVGAAAVPAGAALATAAKVGVQGARQLPSLARMFVEPAAVNPTRFAGKEAAMALGAGGGAALANEAVDPTTTAGKWADFGGAVTGATAAGLGGMLASGGWNVFNAIRQNPNYVDDVVNQAVTDRLGRAAGVPSENGVMDTGELANLVFSGTPGRRRPSDVIPGFQESTADRSGNAGLAALEFSRQQGPNAGDFAARRGANTEAVDRAMTAVEPTVPASAFREALDAERGQRLTEAAETTTQAQDDVANILMDLQVNSTPQARGATIRTGADEALQNFIQAAEQARITAAQQAETASGALTPRTDPAVRGNTIRTELEAQRDAARQRTADAYQQADVANNPVDPTDLRATLEGVRGGLTETERGLVPQGVIDRVSRLGIPAEEGVISTGLLDASGQPIARPPAPPQPVTLKEATDLSSELKRLQRAALADPRAEKGGRNAARVLGQYIEAVDGYVARNLTNDQQQAVDAARGAKFDEAEAFTRTGDPVAAVLGRHEGGQPRVRDEAVAGRFVNSQTDEPLNRLFSEADTPDVRNAIQDEILSRITPEMRADPARLDAFLQQHAIPLRQFGGLRTQIETAAAAQRNAAGAADAVTARRQEFSGDSRALADTTARRSDGTPALLDEQIPGRFVNPTGNRDIDALLSRADTPEVRQALEEEILARAGADRNDPRRLQQFVDSYAEPLQKFPGLSDRIARAAETKTAAGMAQGAEEGLKRDLGTPGNERGTSTVGKYLRFDDTNAEQAMDQVLSHPRPAEAADEALSFVGDAPKAVEGARSAFWKVLRRESQSSDNAQRSMGGKFAWRGDWLKSWLDKPSTAAVAERLYKDNPDHLKRIREIADVLDNVDLRQRGKAAGTSGTGQGVNPVLTPETLQSRGYAYMRGQISGTYLATSIAAVVARRAVRNAQTSAIERITDKALLDPDFAAALLKDNNPANRAAVARKAKGWMGNEAATLVDIMNDPDEDDVARIVMKGRKENANGR